ncbi:MAG: hypothetical protein ACYCZ2_09410 [Lutibacter sp.]
MCQEVQELKNDLNRIRTSKIILTEAEYQEQMSQWKRKWIDMALTHNCSKHNDDKMIFTISLN